LSTVGIMAMVAEEARRKRTTGALAAAKRRGVKLGGRRRKIIGTDEKGKPTAKSQTVLPRLVPPRRGRSGTGGEQGI
jgi:hypothetical protein